MVNRFGARDVYQIQRTCLNGHVVTNNDINFPETPYCSKCGAETIAQCPKCNGPLRGGLPGVLTAKAPSPKSYCPHCGSPYPWTSERMKALEELAQITDTLDDNDRSTITTLLPDLLVDAETPRTPVAAAKFKKVLKKGGAAFTASARELFVDVSATVIKKVLFEP